MVNFIPLACGTHLEGKKPPMQEFDSQRGEGTCFFFFFEGCKFLGGCSTIALVHVLIWENVSKTYRGQNNGCTSVIFRAYCPNREAQLHLCRHYV